VGRAIYCSGSDNKCVPSILTHVILTVGQNVCFFFFLFTVPFSFLVQGRKLGRVNARALRLAHPSSEGVRGLPGSTEYGGTGDTRLDTEVRATPRAHRVKGKAGRTRPTGAKPGRFFRSERSPNHHRQTPAPPVAKRCDGGGGCGASCSCVTWLRCAVNGCVVSITCRAQFTEGWALARHEIRRLRRGGRGVRESVSVVVGKGVGACLLSPALHSTTRDYV